MKTVSSFLIAVALAGCAGHLREEKRQNSQLDNVVHKIQRAAFFQRQYYWEVIKWRDEKNEDSLLFYEAKKDSAENEYKFYNRLYDSLIKLYEQKNQ